jgi:hypothetical protein
MTDTARLRAAVSGLVAFAAEEETVLLAVPGMACYGLACAQARSGRTDDALAAIRQAISLNPELRASADRDADLAALRDAGRLTTLLS